MAKNIKILYVSQEIIPYLQETEIATISRQLPQAIQEKGREIRTFVPKYGCINERRHQLHEVIRLSGMNLIIDDTDHPLIIKVASIQSARMQVYFIDNDEYFPRKFSPEGILYNNVNFLESDNNEERCIFFVRGVLETIKKLRWTPDIIHCHGWMTSLMPLYIKKAYHDEPFFKNSKVILSLYDKEFPFTFSSSFPRKLLLKGVEETDLVNLSEETDYKDLTKLAIAYADGVIQGSENVNNTLLNYITESNKLFLPYQKAETYVDAYNRFYDKVITV